MIKKQFWGNFVFDVTRKIILIAVHWKWQVVNVMCKKNSDGIKQLCDKKNSKTDDNSTVVTFPRLFNFKSFTKISRDVTNQDSPAQAFKFCLNKLKKYSNNNQFKLFWDSLTLFYVPTLFLKWYLISKLSRQAPCTRNQVASERTRQSSQLRWCESINHFFVLSRWRGQFDEAFP